VVGTSARTCQRPSLPGQGIATLELAVGSQEARTIEREEVEKMARVSATTTE
jgi:hypothetical protein